jgi:hypothetical protein
MLRSASGILLAFLALATSLDGRAAPVTYTGLCDASAAVLLDGDRFVVANDEDNLLRTYSLARPGAPLAAIDVGAFLGADKEADIEGAARSGKRIYWIASHGANKNGKPRPDRHRLFATDVRETSGGPALAPWGAGHRTLDVLLSRVIGGEYDVKDYARTAPEHAGGVNIEGLAVGPAGSLLVGFRNPVPAGKALVVPLIAPDAYLAATAGAAGVPVAPTLGKTIELDLGKRGIRSIERVPGTSDYLIVAGPPGAAGAAGTGTFALFGWRMGQAPVRLRSDWPADFRPEGLMIDRAGKKIYLLSDDGDACRNPPAFRLLSAALPTW